MILTQRYHFSRSRSPWVTPRHRCNRPLRWALLTFSQSRSMARYTCHTNMNTLRRRRDAYRTSTPPMASINLLYLYAWPLCFSSIKHAWNMSASSGEPWLDGSSAPHVPYLVWSEEKTSLAGALLGAILYGTPARIPSPLSSPRVHLALPSRNRYCPLLSMYERFAQSN